MSEHNTPATVEAPTPAREETTPEQKYDYFVMLLQSTPLAWSLACKDNLQKLVRASNKDSREESVLKSLQNEITPAIRLLEAEVHALRPFTQVQTEVHQEKIGSATAALLFFNVKIIENSQGATASNNPFRNFLLNDALRLILDCINTVREVRQLSEQKASGTIDTRKLHPAVAELVDTLRNEKQSQE